MVNLKELQKLMGKRNNIRNVSIIAHIDHGKSTLADFLISKAGIIQNDEAGERRFMDDRDDEQERCITIKSSSVSLCYSIPEELIPKGSEGSKFLINLIDSPGHIDFSAEVTAALRVTDGALVVIDCIEGVLLQTETVLRLALGERIKPVVILNKIDRCLYELIKEPEEIYKTFTKIIDNVNAIISTYSIEDGPMGQLLVSPEQGTICFGSGLYGFGFTLTKFAQIYSLKFGVQVNKLVPLLWGDRYFDTSVKKFIKNPVNSKGEPLERTFCQYVLKPIVTLIRKIMEKKKDEYMGMLSILGIKLKENEEQLEEKELANAILKRWLPIADALLEMIVLHLPSPAKAQKYRVENLYTGKLDDECAIAIRDCNPKGPLMLYVSKMIPTQDKRRFYAFGRVFSGTVSASQNVRIIGMNYDSEKKNDWYTTKIQQTVIMMGKKTESIDDCPCGNTIALVGVDKFFLKSGTITTSDNAHPIKEMKFSVAPVVRVAVQPDKQTDLSKFIDGLDKLSKSDPCVVVSHEKTGEIVVAGVGEFHLEICIHDLEIDYAHCQAITSTPTVSFRETVQELSCIVCTSRSENCYNTIRCQAQPLDDELTNEIEIGAFSPILDNKIRSKILQKRFGWDKRDSTHVWSFGPDSNGPNLLVNTTISSQYLHEIKVFLNASFQYATKLGVLCEEPLRGVRFNITDVYLNPDSSYRTAGQIIPCGRRVLYASELTANPTLVEPIYLCQITCPLKMCGSVYGILLRKRGQILDQQPKENGTSDMLIKAYLPVIESCGLDKCLKSSTSGQASMQMQFDHWKIMQGNPFEENNILSDTIMNVRKQKGLDIKLPPLDKFITLL